MVLLILSNFGLILQVMTLSTMYISVPVYCQFSDGYWCVSACINLVSTSGKFYAAFQFFLFCFKITGESDIASERRVSWPLQLIFSHNYMCDHFFLEQQSKTHDFRAWCGPNLGILKFWFDLSIISLYNIKSKYSYFPWPVIKLNVQIFDSLRCGKFRQLRWEMTI